MTNQSECCYTKARRRKEIISQSQRHLDERPSNVRKEWRKKKKRDAEKVVTGVIYTLDVDI